jgi:hypothetical protein
MVDVEYYQGEARWLSFRISLNNKPLDISADTFGLEIRKYPDDEQPLIKKVDVDFNKTYAVDGVISVFLTGADTNRFPGEYEGQLKIVDTNGGLRKTPPFNLKIGAAVIKTVFELTTLCLAVSEVSTPELTL